MAKPFNLTIITPEATVYDGNVSSLVAPSKLGYLGVLADHAPLIAMLVAGRITIRDDSGTQKLFDSNGSGILEVANNRATILLSSAH